jgi:Flp pilus assembly pilin Flp
VRQRQTTRRTRRDRLADKGATTVEYALVASMISLLIVASTITIGFKVLAFLTSFESAMP